MTGIAANDVEIPAQNRYAHLTPRRLHFGKMRELLRDGIVADEIWKVTRCLSAATDDVNQSLK